MRYSLCACVLMLPALVLGAAGCSSAEMSATTTGNPDAVFMAMAAKGGMAEVELGKVAIDRATSPDVRAFAQRVVNDHKAMNEDLKQTAKEMNLTLPMMPHEPGQMLVKALRAMPADKFDGEYVAYMVAMHRHDVAGFEHASTAGSQKVREFANRHLPMLRDHLKMAEDMNKKLSPPPK